MQRRIQFGFLLCVLAAPRGGAAATVAQNDVVATVNGETITRTMLVDRLLLEFGKGLLEDLIDELIVLQEARKQKLEVTDKELDARVQQHKEALPPTALPLDDRYKQWLKERRFTEAAFRERLRTIVLLEKLVAPTIKVDDAALSRFILENRSIFDDPDRVKLRGIMKRDRSNAEAVRRAATLKTEPFEKLAEKYSEDEGTRPLGGDLGIRPLDTAMARVGIIAEKGSISPVVPAENGYWVYQVVEVMPAKKKDLKEVLPLARTMLRDQQITAAASRYFEELKRKSLIYRNLK